MRIIIDEKFLELFGTGSLIGYIANQSGAALTSIKEVTLVFQETTLSWREKHGGPAHWVVLEYVPKCLIDDILHLMSLGISVKTEVGPVGL